MNRLKLNELYEQLIATAPLIQNITNTVVQQFSANVLLAVGASPAMLDHEADAGQFAAVADGILVNFGTVSNQQLIAADAAIEVAHDMDKPWVLDPVAVGATDFRTARIQQIITRCPAVIRGNASEIIKLADMGCGGRGVDATEGIQAALPAAVQLAQLTNSVIAISGKQDVIVAVHGYSAQIAWVTGGHALMSQVIGTGCSLGSLTTAYLAAARSSFRDLTNKDKDLAATVAAHAHFALAGRIASRQASGPGSYAVAFLDALSSITSQDMAQAAITIESRKLPAGDPL